MMKTNSFSLEKKALLAIETLQKKIDELEKSKHEPIAVIGMACRFPGGIDTTEKYWEVLKNEKDLITEVPGNRWDLKDVYTPDPSTPGKTYTRHGAFLNDVDKFDSYFFGISPNEANNMDPQHRLLLEVGWEAMENACILPKTGSQRKIGTFVGIGQNDYFLLHQKNCSTKDISTYTSTGNGFCFASGRLSYIMGFQGPCLSIDTACSSSLVSLHLACQSLRAKECDVALSGGVQLMLSPEVTISLSKSGALSPTGHCKTFSADADGFARGEGCGIIVLKRLSDAIAERDNILAVINGSAVNHDGISSGLTVPNGKSQQKVIEEALTVASIKPSEIGYIETHGTGTQLGDPIEIEAIGNIFAKERFEEFPLLVGSVKSNIGHLEAAAGIASVIKVILCIQKKKIPANIHLNGLNKHIPWENLPVKVVNKLTEWSPIENKRVAGVSSFGLSGTNAHVILQEYNNMKDNVNKGAPLPIQIFCISAKNSASIEELKTKYIRFIQNNPEVRIEDLCYSSNTCRNHFKFRHYVITDSSEDLKSKLESHELQFCDQFKAKDIAFLFTGQGSQFSGMGKELYETYLPFKKSIDKCSEILEKHINTSLKEVLFTPENESLLNNTAYTQPALFALEYALAQLWISWGIKPSVVIGHSVGEYVAACIAKVFSLEDALTLIAERGRLMQSLPLNGKMAAIFTTLDKVQEIVNNYPNEISIAAINDDSNIVISGLSEIVDKITAKLNSEGIAFKILNVSHAFHSQLMKPIIDEFFSVARNIKYKKPAIPVISNISGNYADDKIATAEYWAEHILATVDFSGGIRSISDNVNTFIEIGPKPVLINLAKNIKPDTESIYLPSLQYKKYDWYSLLDSLGELYKSGVEINWEVFYETYQLKKIAIPTYAFQRKTHWLESSNKTIKTKNNMENLKVSDNTLDNVVKLFQEQITIINSLIKQQNIDIETFPVNIQEYTQKINSIANTGNTVEKKNINTEESVEQIIHKTISEITKFPISEIKNDYSLIDDLGFDSISLAVLNSRLGKTSAGKFAKTNSNMMLKKNFRVIDIIEMLNNSGSYQPVNGTKKNLQEVTETFKYGHIDDALGDGRKRYFSNGFRKINHLIKDITLNDVEQSLQGILTVEYPEDWSGKNPAKKLKPHLSVLDAFLVTAQLNEAFLACHFGLSNEMREKIWISKIKMKAGVIPETSLENVKIATQYLNTSPNNNNVNKYESTFISVIGTINVEMVICHDLSDDKTTYKVSEVIDEIKKQYFGTGYKIPIHEITDIEISGLNSSISSNVNATNNESIRTNYGQGKAFFPSFSWPDCMLISGQLTQALVYTLDKISRDNTNNLWMREISAEYINPLKLEVNRAFIKVTEFDTEEIDGRIWRFATLHGNIGNMQGEFKVTHLLPKEHEVSKENLVNNNTV